MKEQAQTMQIAAEAWGPAQVLEWAFDTFGDAVAISSAFGVEGMVLIDIASRVRPNFRLFTLDSGQIALLAWIVLQIVKLRNSGLNVFPVIGDKDMQRAPAIECER